MKKIVAALLIVSGLVILGISAQVYLSPTFAEGPKPDPNPP
jgi:hypothetical protein